MTTRGALPPPPTNPVRPPFVSLVGEETTSIATTDGISLEARWVIPAAARRIAVLAHPHPLYGGTMHNAVIVAIAKAVGELGGGVLRFNFRGVEGSTGKFDGGTMEVEDVAAALRAARSVLPGAEISLLGYSFGSWVSLMAAGRLASSAAFPERLAMIAPAARLFDFFRATENDQYSRPKLVVVGDRDEFCTVPEADAIAAHLGAKIAARVRPRAKKKAA